MQGEAINIILADLQKDSNLPINPGLLKELEAESHKDGRAKPIAQTDSQTKKIETYMHTRTIICAHISSIRTFYKRKALSFERGKITKKLHYSYQV